MAVTTPPTVDAPPEAPSTSAPSTFSAKADAFLAWLATFRTQLIALATNVYNNALDAASNATIAWNAAINAAADADTAAAAALSAANAPGTSSTSTTSDTIATGPTTLTIQPGKALVPGMFIVAASTASPANYNFGQVTAYNSGTGQLDLNVLSIGGAGTFAAWSVSLATPPNAAPQWQIKTANYTAVAGDRIQANTSGGAFAITLPANPAVNDLVSFADYAGTFGTNGLTIYRNGSNIMGLVEHLTVRRNNIRFDLQYIDATKGWRIV